MKGWYKDMTYKKFHDKLIRMLTEKQIAVIQAIAFQNYKDAHGYMPESKGEKQLAYDFIIDFLRNMEITECVGYLKPLGIPLITAIALWNGLE